MDYEAELDAQISALEKEIDKRKRIRAFWEKSIPDTEKLLKKWRVMWQHMQDENNRIEVAMNLEIMNILIGKHKITEEQEEGTIKQFIMPIIARCDKDGNVRK
jgi:hypothetical protein